MTETPGGMPVLRGDGGWSAKAGDELVGGPVDGSHWYTLTALAVRNSGDHGRMLHGAIHKEDA